jgi:hypothetical protein
LFGFVSLSASIPFSASDGGEFDATLAHLMGLGLGVRVSGEVSKPSCVRPSLFVVPSINHPLSTINFFPKPPPLNTVARKGDAGCACKKQAHWFNAVKALPDVRMLFPCDVVQVCRVGWDGKTEWNWDEPTINGNDRLARTGGGSAMVCQ